MAPVQDQGPVRETRSSIADPDTLTPKDFLCGISRRRSSSIRDKPPKLQGGSIFPQSNNVEIVALR
jgi:hypothetical protein